MTTDTRPSSLGDLSLAELGAAYESGRITFADMVAECDRRDAADRRAARSARARAAARARNAEWYDAARAQYDAAEAACNGDANMLNRRGRRVSRLAADPFALWYGSEEIARRYASDDLLRFWDHVMPRMAPPAEYARQQRDAARWEARDAADQAAELADQAAELADQAAGAAAELAAELVTPAPRPTVRLVTRAAPRPTVARPEVRRVAIPAAPVVPPMRPGAIARYAAGLTALADHTDRLSAAILARRDQQRRAS